MIRQMTIKELKQQLEAFEDDDIVMFKYPSRDYWGNVLASHITFVEYGEMVWSDYHRTNKVLDPDRESDPDDEGEITTVVIIE